MQLRAAIQHTNDLNNTVVIFETEAVWSNVKGDGSERMHAVWKSQQERT